MKAEINKHGRLIVSAQTELEAYALEKWSDENPENHEKILIIWNLEKPSFTLNYNPNGASAPAHLNKDLKGNGDGYP